jgi:hypothetical protein
VRKPFTLSLSKGLEVRRQGFDKLSPNGNMALSPNGISGFTGPGPMP